jgi:superfamily I DNA/RNA helicase
LYHEGLTYLGISRLQSIFPTYQQDRNLFDVLGSFTNLLWESYERNVGDWPKAVDDFIGLDSIPIMTIHKSKGLEYSIVYFIGLEDSAFWNFQKQPLEDRSAFFVALSRAKLEVVFTFCSLRESHQYKLQSRRVINEFYELLKNSNLVEIHSFYG